MNEEDLKSILEGHKDWLLSDGSEGKRADLNNVDLRDADLRWANLSNANLNNVDLREADLSGTRVKIMNLSRHPLIKYPTDVSIGCVRHSLKYWFKNLESIGKKYKYSDSEITEYRVALNFVAELFKQETT